MFQFSEFDRPARLVRELQVIQDFSNRNQEFSFPTKLSNTALFVSGFHSGRLLSFWGRSPSRRCCGDLLVVGCAIETNHRHRGYLLAIY